MNAEPRASWLDLILGASGGFTFKVIAHYRTESDGIQAGHEMDTLTDCERRRRERAAVRYCPL